MKKLALSLLPLLLLLPLTTAWAQDVPFLSVRAQMPSGVTVQMVPLLATVSTADAARVLGKRAEVLANGMVTATEYAGGRWQGVAAQASRLDDGNIRIAVLLPSQPAGLRHVRLLAAPPSFLGPAGLQAETRDGVVTVTNTTYAITHDPAKNGGLPGKIVFPQTGKVFDTFTFNDRVHSKQEGMGGFRLSEDKTPEVRLRAAGPLYAEVRVKGRYMQGQKAPPGDAQATYTYSYFAGSPVVRVSGDISQTESFSWNELHFFELYFKDDSFTHYATDSEAAAPFGDDSKSHRGAQWGGLVEGRNAIGLLGSAMIYDGKSDYGRYLHGPWVQWSMPTARFALDLWLGAADDPVATIGGAAESKLRVLAGTVYSPKLLAQVGTLEQRSKQQPRLGSMLSLLEGALQQQKLSLAEAEQAAAAMLADKPAAGDTLRLGEQALYVAASQGLGMALSREQDRIVSLYDLRHGRELLAAPALWFRLELGNAEGGRRTLDSTDFFLRQPAPITAGRRPSELQLFSKGAVFPGLTVTLRPSLLDDRLQWSLEVDNARADWSLLSVTAPVLQVGQLGDDVADDRLLVPNGFGRSYPVLGRPPYISRYPSGGACMQWMAVTDDASGLYLGCHDPTAGTKTVIAGTMAEAGVPLSFEVFAPDATVPGNDFSLPGEFVMAAVDGGYFPACRLYREWLDQKAPWWPEPGKFSRSDYPQWIQDIETWVLWGAGDAEKTVAPTKEFAQAMGVPTAIHWYNWHAIPFDNDYPHYFPTRPGFREGVKELQQAGVRVMPYINGRLWDTDTQSFIDEAHQYATKREDGTPYIEVYGSKQELAPMCLQTQYWQDKVQEIVMKLVAEEGVDGVYIDQVAAASPVLCYDKSHGHPLAGGHWWVDGYWKMLRELQEKIARVHPDKMLTTESNAESYAKYFDAYLMCNSNSDYEAPLFPAVYGGKILMFGTYMSDGDWQDLTLMALRQGKLFAFGTQLWWSNPHVVKNEAAARWLRDLAHLRQRVNEFFVHGQMAAPPVFAEKTGMLTTGWRNNTQIHTPDLWATTWRLGGPAEARPLLMPLVNLPGGRVRPHEQRTFTLQFDPAVYGLKANARVKIERMTAAGVAETVTKQGKFALPVTLGPAEATALVITPH